MSYKILRRPPWRATALSIGVGMALTACAVGPDFHAPDTPTVADASHPYTPAPMPALTASAPGPGGDTQHFVDGQDISATWWNTFHSAPLDALVRSALSNSPSIAAAQATLRQAEENYRADYGARVFPSVSASLQGGRERFPVAQAVGEPAGATANLFTAALDVSYTLDVFGGNRRELEGVKAAIDAQRFQVEATWLSLTSSVVATAIQEASLRAQLQATNDVVDAETKSLGVISRQVELGALARSAVLQQQTLVAQTQAQVPALQKSLAQTRHQLAVLAGRLPGDAGLPTFDLDSLTLPHELPVSVPSALVRQRPDVRASEAALHEASAQIGVATANLYPQITAQRRRGPREPEDRPPVRHRHHRLEPAGRPRAADLQRRFAAGAQARLGRSVRRGHRAVPEHGAQRVPGRRERPARDRHRRRRAAHRRPAEQLAKQTLDLVVRQYQLGAVSYLASLDAQRTYLQTRTALVQAQAARYTDTAALFQALGGGWWNAPDAVASAAPASGAAR